MLSPKCRRLYETMIRSKSNTRKMLYLQTKLKMAEKIGTSKNFQNLVKHVNPGTYNFIVSQVRSQLLKSRGRRFTLDDKLLALTLLKASGRGYTYFKNIFPSRRTLTNLLSQIFFKPGVCDHIFESLRQSTIKMKNVDKLAILVFDEMSIDSMIPRRIDSGFT